jgi:hypothetical protein
MARRLFALVVPVALSAALAVAASATPGANRTRQPGPVVVQTTRSGFAWGDAAIGAATALGVVLAVTGVLVLKGDRDGP